MKSENSLGDKLLDANFERCAVFIRYGAEGCSMSFIFCIAVSILWIVRRRTSLCNEGMGN